MMYYCVWSLYNIRRLKGYYNFVPRDFEYFDDFQPLFDVK